MKCIKPATVLSPAKSKNSSLTVFNHSEPRYCLFTSESVSEGHPDKLADRISDTVLDRFLQADPFAKVACETFIADRLVVVAGEFHTTPSWLFQTIRSEIPDLVRQVIRETGSEFVTTWIASA